MQSNVEAVRWFKLAAAQELPQAQYNLAVMYESGAGIAQDFAEAVRLYDLAASQGVAIAQFNLGLMYEKGTVIAQNSSMALFLFKLAAEQGFAHAQTKNGNSEFQRERRSSKLPGRCSMV